MLADVVGWYLRAVSDFWGDFLRLGVLQLLLVVLALWWLGGRGRCCSGLSGWIGRWCAKSSTDGVCCTEDCRVRCCCRAKTRCCRNRDQGAEADECCTEGAYREAAGDDPSPPGPDDD